MSAPYNPLYHRNTVSKLIQKIMAAQSLLALFPTGSSKKQYREAVKQLHPDLCTEPMAEEALIRLNELRMKHEKGIVITDDAGSIWTQNKEAIFRGDLGLLRTSIQNYQHLKHLKSEAAQHFTLYLPQHMEMTDILKAEFPFRAIPLHSLELPQEHVNWVLSRLLELVAWLAQEGFVHGGINPRSIFILPETHGIVLTSFYHMKKVGDRLTAISAAYQHWYPKQVFTEKRASSLIDLECCKRTAAYLLGDKSGLGVKLKKSHLGEYIDFLLDRHENAYTCYDEYRKLLQRHFEPRFVPLAL
ncbi:MAG: hypothetical protein KTR30_09315 [Saprospiraceae bacterium]|nr:hypothetical protein [Saprospiraceae bacterium]